MSEEDNKELNGTHYKKVVPGKKKRKRISGSETQIRGRGMSSLNPKIVLLDDYPTIRT